MLSIPVIDISSLPGDTATIEQIARAGEEFGCFHTINHGIDTALGQEFFDQMRAFFALPRDTKQLLCRSADNPWGYYDQELTKNTQDWKQIFDYGVDQHGGEFHSASQWPTQLEGFEATMMAWYHACELVSSRLLAAMCEALGMPANALASDFAPQHSSFVRLNYYPPCDDPAVEDAPTEDYSGHLGINYHTDAGALTVLAHDEVPGLQVYHENAWHTVSPHPEGLFINFGDMMQVWSNDRFRAVEHRVLASATRERFSAPFFYNPSWETVCHPLESTTATRPAHYREIPWGEYRLKRAAGDYANYGDEVQISWYRTNDQGTSD